MELNQMMIGIILLILGVPIGLYLAKITKDESVAGQRWFKIVVIVALAGAIISLVLGNDIFLFSFLFIAIVSGMSLRGRKK